MKKKVAGLKLSSIRFCSLYLALFFIVAAMLQLFSFEDYPGVVASYDMPVISSLSLLTAALLVTVEVLAIPFLLGMSVAPRMREVSMMSGAIALVYWLGIGLWQSLTTIAISNAGLFGANILLPHGWWLVSYVLALITMDIVVILRQQSPRS